MAYSHAERTLATIRLLRAQAEELLGSLSGLHPEQPGCPPEAAEAAPPARDARTWPPPASASERPA